MGEYDRAIATAQRLIAKKGQRVTWRKLGNSTPDATKPWLPAAATDTDYENTPICFLPPGRVGEELVAFIKGTEVTSGNVQGLMPAVAFEPDAKDVVIRGGKTLRVKSINPLAPNGEVVLYTIEFYQ